MNSSFRRSRIAFCSWRDPFRRPRPGRRRLLRLRLRRFLRPRVFIQCDIGDRPHAEQLKDSLSQLPCLPLLADHSGTPEEIRHTTAQRVRECDALILYWGSKAANWVTDQLWSLWSDINGREQQLKALAICKGPPPGKSAEKFGFPHDPLVWPDGSEGGARPLSEWVATLGGAS